MRRILLSVGGWALFITVLILAAQQWAVDRYMWAGLFDQTVSEWIYLGVSISVAGLLFHLVTEYFFRLHVKIDQRLAKKRG